MKASSFKCCVCRKKKAVAFWPCVDPDIESHPYCRECLEKTKNKLLIKLMGMGMLTPKGEPK